MNYAYAELDIEKRNPFSRVYIKGEGLDVKKRGTFTHEQLIAGYKEALSRGRSGLLALRRNSFLIRLFEIILHVREPTIPFTQLTLPLVQVCFTLVEALFPVS